MTFNVDEGLHIEAVDDGYLVLDPAVDANRVYELRGDQAEAFALARVGTDDVPDELAPAMAGLVHLGLVRNNTWSRRRILQLGGAATAAAVGIIALPGIAAAGSPPGDGSETTTTPTTEPGTTAPPTTAPEQLLSTYTPGAYSVDVPAGRTLQYSLSGAAGANAEYGLYQDPPPPDVIESYPGWLGLGGSGATVSGTIPPSSTGYSLDVIVGYAGAPSFGATGAGGGGGDASVLRAGSTILIVAPGGGGGGTCVQWGWVGAPPPIGGNGALGGQSAVARSRTYAGVTGSSLAGGGAGSNGAGGTGGGKPGLSWAEGGNGGGGGADAGHPEPPGGNGSNPPPGGNKPFQVGGEQFHSGGGGGGGYGGGAGGEGGDYANGGGGGGGGGWIAIGSPDGAITGYGFAGVTLTLT